VRVPFHSSPNSAAPHPLPSGEGRGESGVLKTGRNTDILGLRVLAQFVALSVMSPAQMELGRQERRKRPKTKWSS
jgi:hypothetical protein